MSVPHVKARKVLMNQEPSQGDFPLCPSALVVSMYECHKNYQVLIAHNLSTFYLSKPGNGFRR